MDFAAISPIISSEMFKNSYIGTKNDVNHPEKVGKEFEALFYQTILNNMAKSITAMNKDKGNNMQEQWAWSMMAQTIAQDLAKESQLTIGEQLQASK